MSNTEKIEDLEFRVLEAEEKLKSHGITIRGNSNNIQIKENLLINLIKNILLLKKLL